MRPSESMIAIIGASGFIGKNLFRYIDRIWPNSIPVYFSHQTGFEKGIQFDELLMSDFTIDKVVFCGGNSNHNVSNEDLFQTIEKDSKYIHRFFEQFTCTKAILISSAAVYYGYKGIVDENTCPKPDNNYGLSKRTAEMVFEKEVHHKGCSGVVLRLTHAYGPGERDNRLFRSIAKAIVNKQVLKVHGSGESYINPVSLEFLCKVIEYFLAMNITIANTEYYNVGSSESFRVKDVVSELQEHFNFAYEFEGAEEQPVTFATNVQKLGKLGLNSRNTINDIVDYIRCITKQ